MQYVTIWKREARKEGEKRGEKRGENAVKKRLGLKPQENW